MSSFLVQHFRLKLSKVLLFLLSTMYAYTKKGRKPNSNTQTRWHKNSVPRSNLGALTDVPRADNPTQVSACRRNSLASHFTANTSHRLHMSPFLNIKLRCFHLRIPKRAIPAFKLPQNIFKHRATINKFVPQSKRNVLRQESAHHNVNRDD